MRLIRLKSNQQRSIHTRGSIAILCALMLALGSVSRGYSQENVDNDLLDIRNSQFDTSFETLLVGESEIPIIVKESTTAITRGVAILYTDYGSSPFSEHGIGQLATYLNDLGWVTIAVQAPKDGFIVQMTADEPAPAERPALPSSVEIHAKQGIINIEQQAFEQQESVLKQQIQALQIRADEYPGFFLVVSEGTTAAWLTKIFAEKQVALPDALVSVSPHWPEHQFNQSLALWVAQTEMPYLDIYTNGDNDWAASTVSNRKIQAVKSLKMMYRQRKLIGQSVNSVQHGFLAKEIYGWLTHMGW